ncbi:MAG: hypothetical protein WAT39_14385 [Planctomycetota bacterium]
MIDPDFLAMLVCPASRKPLRLATAAELATVNQAIAGGEAKNRGGTAVTVPWAAALATADGEAMYPIQDGIPILLTAEAIVRPATR